MVNVLKLVESNFGKPTGGTPLDDAEHSLEVLHQELIMLELLVSGSGNLQDKPMQVRECWEMLKCAYQVLSLAGHSKRIGLMGRWNTRYTSFQMQFVNTTGVSPVSIGLVERLMTTCYWCRHVGGEGCDPMGSAVQVQVLVLCTFSTDPGRINTPSQQCLT